MAKVAVWMTGGMRVSINGIGCVGAAVPATTGFSFVCISIAPCRSSLAARSQAIVQMEASAVKRMALFRNLRRAGVKVVTPFAVGIRLIFSIGPMISKIPWLNGKLNIRLIDGNSNLKLIGG
jgi:hypothetical protein